jgi:hypothetical protein
MPAKFMIADEVNDSYTADVLASGALETASLYSYAYLNSAVGATSVTQVPCILHSVTITNTASAANAVLCIGTMAASLTAACASGLSVTTASTVARIGCGARGNYILDAYLGTNLIAYIASQDCDGITLTYQNLS